MKLKLISIDFWNTLFTTDSSQIRNSARLKVLMQTLKDINVTIDQLQFDTALQMSGQYYNDKWINEVRTPSATEVLTFVWDKMNLPPNKQALKYIIEFFEKSILYFPPDMEPGAKAAIELLNSKYQLGIISDTGFSPGAVMTQLLEELDIKKYFDGFSFSDETGVAKPHPKAFNTLLEQLNIAPENALHIGDIEKTDIAGAKNIGMKAIRYDGDSDSSLIQIKSEQTKADMIANTWDEIVQFLLP